MNLGALARAPLSLSVVDSSVSTTNRYCNIGPRFSECVFPDVARSIHFGWPGCDRMRGRHSISRLCEHRWQPRVHSGRPAQADLGHSPGPCSTRVGESARAWWLLHASPLGRLAVQGRSSVGSPVIQVRWGTRATGTNRKGQGTLWEPAAQHAAVSAAERAGVACRINSSRCRRARGQRRRWACGGQQLRAGRPSLHHLCRA